MSIAESIFGKLEEIESVTVLVAIALVGLFFTANTLIVSGNTDILIEVIVALGGIISAILAILRVKTAFPETTPPTPSPP